MDECFLCGRNGYSDRLEVHHIFFGTSNRKWSEKYNLVVMLCGERCNRNGKQAVHKNKDTAQKLHEYGQRQFMREQGATIDEFRKLFGKNYLDEVE